MAFVRLLRDLMRDKDFGPRIVPIIPDEARTFGMDSFFPTAKIYNPHGQQYLSVDADLMLAYKESSRGQILHVGINEGGSVAAFTAAGSSYATHGEPMVPIYTFYSMFGFQRTADSIWAASDQMARGFLIGATAGRTTLTGEGLQHNDGHSPLHAATNPAVVTYDPAYGYEIGHIVKDGLRRMYGESPENVIYYLTVYNEPIVQPAEPEDVDVEGILRGHVPAPAGRLEGDGAAGADPRLRRRGAVGAGGPAAAARRLRRRGRRLERHLLERAAPRRAGLRRAGLPAPPAEQRRPYVTQRLARRARARRRGQRLHAPGAGPDPAVGPAGLRTLGADGFGLSDTRPAARRHFHIDGPSIAVRAAPAAGRPRRDRPGAAARRPPSSTGCTTSRPARPVNRRRRLAPAHVSRSPPLISDRSITTWPSDRIA